MSVPLDWHRTGLTSVGLLSASTALLFTKEALFVAELCRSGWPMA